MKAAFLGLHHGCLLSLPPQIHLPAWQLPMVPPRTRPGLRPWSPLVLAAAGKANNPEAERTHEAAAPPEKTVQHRDNWFHRLAIGYLSSSLQATIGVERLRLEGYERLVEAAAIISTRHEAKDQQEMVILALKKAFPDAILSMIKTLVPPSKFSRELFATFTTIFFSWMVGPCEARESEFQGKREKNVVYIPKCRFLEATNCVGMCTNLCKLPSQKFIYNSLGMPTYMVPNFEDKSCEIIFGQHPTTDDPALKQPCYQTSCIAKQKYQVNCSI